MFAVVRKVISHLLLLFIYSEAVLNTNFPRVARANTDDAPNTAKLESSLLTVGLMAELSGISAVNGESCRQGFEIARNAFAPHDMVGQRAIRFVYGDHQGDAKTGVLEFKKLTELDHAIAVISIRSQVGMALNPLSERSKIPLLGIVGHRDFLSHNQFAFRFYPQVEREGRELARKALQLKMRQMAVITLEDEWTVSLEEAFVSSYVNDGGQQEGQQRGQIVQRERILPTEVELLPILTRLRGANPDSIFVNVGVSQAGLIIRKLRELGFKQQLFSNFWASYADVLDTAGIDNAQGLIYVSVNLAKPKFLEQFKQLFPHAAPSAATYCCYSALSALLQALRDDCCALGRDELYQCLKRLESLDLLDETLPIRGQEVIYDIVTKPVDEVTPSIASPTFTDFREN